MENRDKNFRIVDIETNAWSPLFYLKISVSGKPNSQSEDRKFKVLSAF